MKDKLIDLYADGVKASEFNLDYGIEIDLIGRPEPEGWKPQKRIRYHGKIKDSLKILTKAYIMVVNGGFSAVNEAFFMKKPVVVVPVPNHAEQWVNARTIKELKVGEIATENNFVNVMLQMIPKLNKYQNNYLNFPQFKNGAEKSADIIKNSILSRK